jgi:FkbM family methyltransferase
MHSRIGKLLKKARSAPGMSIPGREKPAEGDGAEPKPAGGAAREGDVGALLRAEGIRPVLTDIGAAGVSPAVWAPISDCSTIVGFEPDRRNPDPNFGGNFAKAIQINKAVSEDDHLESIEFVLTEYPSCSSTLHPDLEALESFSFRDLFRPVSRRTVPATSLNRVVRDTGLAGINWIKVDSQGTDLRILRSLEAAVFDTLLAVDIEPGLIHAYRGEDLFVDCHAWLTAQGFWLSRLETQGYPKVRPATLETIAERTGVEAKGLMRRLAKAPTAVEGRYLREVAWLAQESVPPDRLVLSAAFGLLDGQRAYAVDVCRLHAERFGATSTTDALAELAFREMV